MNAFVKKTLKIEKYKVETMKGTLQYNISGNGKPNIVLINGGSGPLDENTAGNFGVIISIFL